MGRVVNMNNLDMGLLARKEQEAGERDKAEILLGRRRLQQTRDVTKGLSCGCFIGCTKGCTKGCNKGGYRAIRGCNKGATRGLAHF